MTHIGHSTVLQHARKLVWIVALAVGCASDTTGGPPGEPPLDAGVMEIDPTGNWNLTYMYSEGCGQPAEILMDTFTVTRASSGYALSYAGATTSGTVICTPSSCKLSAVFAWSGDGWQYQQNANMALDTQGSITGNGTESWTDMTGTCSIAFTVRGMKL